MRRVRNRPKIYSNDFHGSGSHLLLITLFNFFFANQKRLSGEKSIMVQNFGVLRLACVPLPVCVPVYPDLSGTRRGFQGGAVPISSGYNREPHHRLDRGGHRRRWYRGSICGGWWRGRCCLGRFVGVVKMQPVHFAAVGIVVVRYRSDERVVVIHYLAVFDDYQPDRTNA